MSHLLNRLEYDARNLASFFASRSSAPFGSCDAARPYCFKSAAISPSSCLSPPPSSPLLSPPPERLRMLPPEPSPPASSASLQNVEDPRSLLASELANRLDSNVFDKGSMLLEREYRPEERMGEDRLSLACMLCDAPCIPVTWPTLMMPWLLKAADLGMKLSATPKQIMVVRILVCNMLDPRLWSVRSPGPRSARSISREAGSPREAAGKVLSRPIGA